MESELFNLQKKIQDLERNLNDTEVKRGELIITLQDKEKVLYDRLRELKSVERQN